LWRWRRQDSELGERVVVGTDWVVSLLVLDEDHSRLY
jgi:hypothetical protein